MKEILGKYTSAKIFASFDDGNHFISLEKGNTGTINEIEVLKVDIIRS